MARQYQKHLNNKRNWLAVFSGLTCQLLLSTPTFAQVTLVPGVVTSGPEIDLCFTFQMHTNRIYTIQYTTNLVAWSDLVVYPWPGNPVPVTDGETFQFCTSAFEPHTFINPQVFFRVVEQIN